MVSLVTTDEGPRFAGEIEEYNTIVKLFGGAIIQTAALLKRWTNQNCSRFMLLLGMPANFVRYFSFAVQ